LGHRAAPIIFGSLSRFSSISFQCRRVWRPSANSPSFFRFGSSGSVDFRISGYPLATPANLVEQPRGRRRLGKFLDFRGEFFASAGACLAARSLRIEVNWSRGSEYSSSATWLNFTSPAYLVGGDFARHTTPAV
jgi:hypothetical protein